jgi:prepilin-type N-terminal cleavage/methylation domain-containing protein
MIRKVIRTQSGFSLIELIVTMTVFVIAIAVISSIFVPMLTQFKQQSKVAESQVERLVGLDILRRDIEQAGFGLPWVLPAGLNYQETIADMATGWVERDYNDGPPNNPARGTDVAGASNPPAAIRNGDDIAGTLNNSDVLILKATSIATNDAASKWTYVVGAAGGTNNVNMWGSPVDDLINGDRAIVIIPMRGENNQRILVADSGAGFNFSVSFSNPLPNNSPYAPSTEGDTYLIYGVDPDTNLRMPFNRADYYVERPAGTGEMPPRCAQNTGILYKGIVNQSDGNKTPIRLIECVADMQLVFGWDTDEDGDFEPGAAGSTDSYEPDMNIYTAAEIREHLKEVRVYILAHEGQRDAGYNFNGFSTDPIVTGACGATCVMVGEVGLGGRAFDLSIIPDFEQYRWKVYTLVVKPANLRE